MNIKKEIMEEFRKKFVDDLGKAGGKVWKIKATDTVIEDIGQFLSQALTRIEEAAYKKGWENAQKQSLSCLCDCHTYSVDKRHCINCDFKLSPQEEKISFEEGEKIVKKIQQKVESYRVTPRYDQGGYHPSEDSVLACVCHCHNNVTHFPGGCMFCSCIHCHPSPEEWEGLLSIIFYKDEDGDRYIKDSIALSDLHEWYDKTISAQKERIRKDIGGMREEDKFGQDEASPLGENALRNWGYNRALDDVLDLLEGDSK